MCVVFLMVQILMVWFIWSEEGCRARNESSLSMAEAAHAQCAFHATIKYVAMWIMRSNTVDIA